MTHKYEGISLNNTIKRLAIRNSGIALLLIALCALAPRSWSQASVGTITGTVTDSTGAVIPNAAVTVTNVQTNIAARTTTTRAGDFAVPYLTPAVYNVTVSAPGFQTAEVHRIVLLIGQVARANVTLKPGASTQTVSVTAGTVSLDTDSSAVGEVISTRQILDLPMENRSFGNLLLLSPGTATNLTGTPGVNAANNVDIGGARADSNGYTIDGLINNESFYGNPIVELSLDAIQEFKEQAATYSAAYGETPAQINVITKSGTNQLHGTAFDFVRNNAFDAVSAFTPAGPVPPLHQNDYGYSLGGPVYIPKIYNGRNHTFFFANFERLVASTSSTLYSIAPTANELQGIIASPTPILDPTTGLPFAQDSSGNYLIPTSRWSRLALVSTKTPGDYFAVAGPTVNGQNSVVVVTDPSFNNQQTYRVDEKLAAKDSFSAQFTLTNSATTTQGIDTYATSSNDTLSQSWNVIETHIFNGHLINNARVGWVDFNTGTLGTAAPSTDVSALGMQNTFSQAGAPFPNIQFTNGYFSNAGGYFGVPVSWGSKFWNVEDTVYWIHGRHNFTFGMLATIDHSITDPLDNVLGEHSFDGSYTAPAGVTPTAGNAWADFLLGDLVNGQAVVPTYWGVQHPSNPPFFINQLKFAPYVNDNWQVTPHLTLNLGLRYDFQSVPDVQHALWGSLSVPGGVVCTTDRQYIASGDGGSLFKYCPRGNATKTPFAPRIGFEVRPPWSSATVLRGGYGVYFDQYEHHEWDSTANYPWAETASETGLNFDNLFPAQSPVATSSDVAGLYNAEPPSLKSPYYQQWSLGVEEQVLGGMKLNVAYVGGMGTHLEGRLPANQPYGYSASDTPAERMARYPYYNLGTYGLNGTPFSPGYLDQGQYVFASNYNSLQSSVNYRTKDLALLASYTWAKSMDDGSAALGLNSDDAGWQGPMDAHDIHRDYAASSFDATNRFVISSVYMLPFGRGQRFGSGINRAADTALGGWQVNGIYTFQSGYPFNTAATDIGAVLVADAQRSNRIGDPFTGFTKSAKEWFNTAAFAQPAEGVFGTESRNDLRAPGTDNLDFSIFKNFALTERPFTFQLRGEAFNALNHVQLGMPGATVTAPNFGVISSVSTPGRIIQIAGKIIF